MQNIKKRHNVSKDMVKRLILNIILIVILNRLNAEVYAIILVLFFFNFLQVYFRGYFWKNKIGVKLSFREFMSSWRDGVIGLTPLQSIKISLWSYLPIFAGLIWGITITFMGKTYWLSLILSGSLPLTTVQFINSIQKYLKLREVDKIVKELNK